MFSPNRFRGYSVPLMLVVMAAVSSTTRPAHANLWDWLFGGRNHSYYAGSQPPQPGPVPQLNSAPQPSSVPQPGAGYPYAPSTYAPNTSAYPPNQQSVQYYGTQPNAAQNYAAQNYAAQNYAAQNYAAQNHGAQSGGNQGDANPNYGNAGHFNQGVGTTQQLTNPLVIIPSSSAPVGGGATPSSAVSASYGPSSVQAAQPSNFQTGAVPGGFTSPGLVTSGFAPVTSFAPATSGMVSHQPQQVFMVNQGAALNQCATCLPGHHRRTASYRTVWYRVPTTNFRPLATVDPCSGVQTTVMRPCTTYSWQARRVPTMRSPSLCERLFGCFKRRPPPTYPVAPTVMSANYACGPTCATVPTANAAAPYYSPPPTTAPANTTYPLGGTSLPATGYPAGAYPQSGSTTPGSFSSPGTGSTGAGSVSPPLREPADQRPSLGPDTRRYAPENDPWPENSPAEDDEDATFDNSASYDDSSQAPPSPLRSLQPGNSHSAPSIHSSHDRTDPRRRDPQPVPDPDAILNPQKRFEPPRLLNPKDRRASLTSHRAGDFVPASWPEKPRSAAHNRSTISPPAPSAREASVSPPVRSRSVPPIQTPLQDSGWRSVPR